jgi:hypothetical protein
VFYTTKILLALSNKEDGLVYVVREDIIRIKEEGKIKEISIRDFFEDFT